MLFNSWQFIVFFGAVFFAYYLLPQAYRWILLLLASFFFYAIWNAGLLYLLFVVIGITYLAAFMICKCGSTLLWKKAWMVVGVLVPLLILFFFKYFNFFSRTMNMALTLVSLPEIFPQYQLLLPVGISFYTFQALSYVTDVYRDETRLEKHLGLYALYISFFPQLIAGPIERASDVLPQFRLRCSFDYKGVTYGLKCMAWGYFMKIVIADMLGGYVDAVYDNVLEYSGFVLIIASVLFVIQVYCDFAGYSLIALGAAQTFGIKLSRNFESPFYSQSLKEFWRRWHITLGTWFKDYLFYPIIRSRFCDKFRSAASKRGYKWLAKNGATICALFAVWTLNGVWHGAGLAYIEYGLLVSVLMVLNLLAKNVTSKTDSVWITLLRRLRTFVIVCCIFVFIRAKSASFSRHVFLNCLDGIQHLKTYLSTGIRAIGMPCSVAIPIAICFGLVMLFDYAALKCDPIEKAASLPAVVRWSIYIVLVMLVLGYFVFSHQIQSPYQFIYFQF